MLIFVSNRPNILESIEDMLIVWLQDLMDKRVPMSTDAIREQVLECYQYLKRNEGSSNKEETFSVSRGQFDRFRKRFRLHIVAFAGESASADKWAALQFTSMLRQLIEEKGYVSSQVFNCDETGFNWKMMPNKTYLMKKEKKAPGYKVSEDRYTFLFCTNASGALKFKPTLVYNS